MNTTEVTNQPLRYIFQPTAYKHCRSIVFWQFSPMFNNTVNIDGNEEEVIWQFQYPNPNGNVVEKIERFYANIFFKMGEYYNNENKSRNEDYKNAWLALQKAIESSTINKNKKNNLIKYVKNWEPPNYVPNGDYLWHHIYMGFQKSPIVIKDKYNISKENPYNFNPYIYNFNDNKTSTIYDKECLNSSDWYNGNWNYKEHFAVMQLVKEKFHSKTLPHLGSNEQRELYNEIENAKKGNEFLKGELRILFNFKNEPKLKYDITENFTTEGSKYLKDLFSFNDINEFYCMILCFWSSFIDSNSRFKNERVGTKGRGWSMLLQIYKKDTSLKLFKEISERIKSGFEITDVKIFGIIRIIKYFEKKENCNKIVKDAIDKGEFIFPDNGINLIQEFKYLYVDVDKKNFYVVNYNFVYGDKGNELYYVESWNNIRNIWKCNGKGYI